AADIDDAQHETRAAFVDYVRSGNDQALRETEAKTLRKNPTTDGGYLVPEVVYTDLDSQIQKQSAMRQLANVVVMGAGDTLHYVRASSAMAARWAGEESARSDTGDGDFKKVDIRLDEIYFNLTATQQFLDDTAIDIEAWIVSSMAQAFAETEGRAFILGSGLTQPGGIAYHATSTTYSATSNSLYSRKSGVNGKLPTGTAGADYLMEFAFGLEAPYSGNASWLMNKAAQSELRKIKDNDGRYLWTPGLEQGTSATLLGYPIYEESHMPNFGLNAKPICFGDFKSGYAIAERQTTHFTRDPYSDKPNIVFYVSRRVGGNVVNPTALRFVQLSA
ncbi:MAG: phage major capsid protein, partial [Alphaproteobacteria bacterium]|nr:phage major capsid protein [Alphaproteobacteria bacterium]